MKSSLWVWVSILLVSGVISCKTQNQAGTTAGESSADSSIAMSKTLSPERERVVKKEKWLGSEIVDEAVNRLDSKLSTSKATNEKLKLVLTDSFKSIGGQISGTYPLKDARDMGKKIIINSQGPILQILENDVQKSAFKELLLN